MFDFQNTGAVEFLVDGAGNFHFTEVKARIQIEHGVSEMITGIDIVREQIRIAAGEPLSRTQEEIRLDGWAMQCRINAEDPWNDYLPSPGRLTRFRLPQGPDVRIDTYGYVGCAIPQRFDPLLANLIVKGDDAPDVPEPPEPRADGIPHRRRATPTWRCTSRSSRRRPLSPALMTRASWRASASTSAPTPAKKSAMTWRRSRP